ncbi:hypothetical protein KY290_007947 [Solanum tuberosum]|uniref:ABC transporter domain-containing protein n=1 Tax=Solanum tuberosum TaxID=4113 RepID=A0ABQ7W8C6_SOLTU|nr:hypothetical protein KY290_007947 [Solanum tuberosum]
MPEVRNILRVVCIDTVMLNLLLIIRLYACHEMKSQGIEETRLQLMDVLAGRKTGGYTDGSIIISVIDIFSLVALSLDVKKETRKCELARIVGPTSNKKEGLDRLTASNFVEEVMELVELNPLRNCLVGLPGVDGLSTKQRKRLTIVVELIANPSIIFMDEPTSGLDARAVVIVMRTVRNTVDTGRTVVCTIH